MSNSNITSCDSGGISISIDNNTSTTTTTTTGGVGDASVPNKQQHQNSEILIGHFHSPINSHDSSSNLTNNSNASNNNTNSQPPPPPPAKRKRSLPGNPDPSAEVIALSPNTLVAKNRFMCEICNKGFQRDQNLQLHRRGHNLPWKLKQRTATEVVRKRVYVCPEPSCVHHNPARALGDLTGIKKHFSRKHGEKKWKCDKCNKKYAVQSDCRAHSKICGTKEYKCDCGTIFSRRDSFITHRAFCDALAEENHNTMINNKVNNEGPKLQQQQGQPISSNLIVPSLPNKNNTINHQNPPHIMTTATATSSSHHGPIMMPITTMPSNNNMTCYHHKSGVHYSASELTPPPHMSATALLHKAAQMGGTEKSFVMPPPPPPPPSSNDGMMMMEQYMYNVDHHQNNMFLSHHHHHDYNNNFIGIDGGGSDGNGVIGMNHGVDMFNAILEQSKALSKIIEQNSTTINSSCSINGSNSSSCDPMMNNGIKGISTDEDHVMTLDLLGIGRGGGGGHGYFGPLA